MSHIYVDPLLCSFPVIAPTTRALHHDYDNDVTTYKDDIGIMKLMFSIREISAKSPGTNLRTIHE